MLESLDKPYLDEFLESLKEKYLVEDFKRHRDDKDFF